MPTIRNKFLPTILLGFLLFAHRAVAQDPADLKKRYDDTLVQLQQSQDRKNQLANENAKLTERISQLEAEIRSLRVSTDRAEFMASQYSAFKAFLARYPALVARFAQYVGPTSTPERDLKEPAEFYDRNWPFSAIRETEGA